MKLVKLTDFFRVGSSKRVLKADWKESGVPFYRGREITRLSKTGSADNELFISESHFKDLSTKYGVPIAGDIMVTAIGTIGNTYIVNERDRFYFKDASVLWLHKQVEVNSRFIDYWLKSDFFFEQLDKGNGATVDTLTIEKLSSVELFLPSLEKQREIVEKLDSAFVEIELLEGNLGLSDEKANHLLQSLLSAAFTAVDEDWESCKIGDLGNWITGSTPSTAKKEFWGDDVPFVTPADLGASGELGEIARRISKLGSEQVRIVIAPSVLLVCIGATLGKVAWTHKTITTNQQINTLQVDDSKSSTKFLMYLLSSPSMQKKLWDSSTGTTVPILNKGNLENIEIFLPSLEKQVEIAKKLDIAFAEIELLRQQIKIEKAYAAALRQSLLSNAFTQEEAVA